jgi:hypothetical protein
MPVTMPEVPIVATDVVVLLHVPDAVASVRFVVEPVQTVGVPVIADGLGLMVTATLPCVPQHPADDCALK